MNSGNARQTPLVEYFLTQTTNGQKTLTRLLKVCYCGNLCIQDMSVTLRVILGSHLEIWFSGGSFFCIWITDCVFKSSMDMGVPC